MKKVNPVFLMAHIGVILGIALALALVIILQDNSLAVAGGFAFGTLFITVPVTFGFVMPAVGKSMRKKTLEQGTVANGMQQYETFDSSNCVVRVDNFGRVALVSTYNPKEFQMFSAQQLTDIKTSYMKGPLGGATAVYFEFRINGIKVKIPTFRSNQAYRMDSNYILDGTAKADYYCQLLYNMQRVS